MIDAEEAAERGEEIAYEAARRDRYFGFAAGFAEPRLFSSWEAEPNETSAPRGLDRPPEEDG